MMVNHLSWRTLGNQTADQIPQLLAQIFEDPKAYKGVPGGADLTDINTGHMIERVTQVFGPKAMGWNFTWEPQDMRIVGDIGANGRVMAHLVNAVFSYALLDEGGDLHWFTIQTSGMNQNSAQYAEEGARTSALGAALKGLCFQIPVYKGLLDHHNAAAVLAAKTQKAQPNGAAVTPGTTVDGSTAPAVKAAAPASKAAPKTVGKPAATPAPAATKAVATIAPGPSLAFVPEELDKVDLSTYPIPWGKRSGKLLAEQSDEMLRWYAVSMAQDTPETRVLAYLANRVLQEREPIKVA